MAAALSGISPETIRHYARLELARRDFWTYCQVREPDFYKPDRRYLHALCEGLQDFLASDDDVLVVNLGPRFGKSRTAGNLAQWCFGRNPRLKIMTGSYNEILSTTFSRGVRNAISEVKADPNRIVFSDIFPGVKIRRGDAAANLWTLEGGYSSYLATSPSGTATGFGADLLIIDDLIKNDYEAYNATTLEAHWAWFRTTMLSRLEKGGKIILVMTRWATGDLSGRVLDMAKEDGSPWRARHITFKTLLDDGTMLCDEIMSRADYDKKVLMMGQDDAGRAIALANYQQEPIDIRGKLYSYFKTYDQLPDSFTGIYAYCDSADTGDDYLVNIIWGDRGKEAYVLDVIYTKEPMEVTEEMVAQALFDYRAGRARFESNAGGRYFSYNVRRRLEQGLTMDDIAAAGRLGTALPFAKPRPPSNFTDVSWFHQSKNKEARILSSASWVCNHVYFPADWARRWPEYHAAMTTYQREGKNLHDDGPDATTGVVETMRLIHGIT